MNKNHRINTLALSPESENLSESGKLFIQELSAGTKHILSNGELNNIIQACILMEEECRGIKRKDGSPYYNHIYRTSLKVLKYLVHNHRRWRPSPGDIKTLLLSILHDTLEDSKNRRKCRKKLGKFKPKLSAATECISKDKILHEFPWAKTIRNEEYFSRFTSLENITFYLHNDLGLSQEEAEKEASIIALVKICDRIDNLETMDDFDAEKINAKIQETCTSLLGLAEEIDKIYPGIHKELSKAIIEATSLSYRKACETIHPPDPIAA